MRLADHHCFNSHSCLELSSLQAVSPPGYARVEAPFRLLAKELPIREIEKSQPGLLFTGMPLTPMEALLVVAKPFKDFICGTVSQLRPIRVRPIVLSGVRIE